MKITVAAWYYCEMMADKAFLSVRIFVRLTSNGTDLVGDGVSQDPLLFHIHHKHPFHDDLQGLQGRGPVVVTTILVADVLL